jgi:outer membrane lipoprotein-sorting protein
MLAAFALGAGAATEGWGLESLMRSLATVKAASGTFVERKHVGILSAPLELKGTLKYTAPGRLEKRTLAPAPSTMVAEGDRLTIEDGTTGEQRKMMLGDHPALRAFVESMRGTLAGDLARLRRFYEIQLDGSERDWRMTLTPLAAEVREWVKEVRLGGSGNRITTIEVLEAGGDRSVMTISGETS